jgi:HEAT repeat protein
LVLLRDVEIKVRQMAVVCLGEIAEPSDDEVLGRLASLLRAGHPSLRYQALLAHSHLRPDEAAADLRVGLGDEDPEIRELSLRLIDEILIAQERHIPIELKQGVVRASADGSPHVRLVAQLVSAECGWDGPVDALLEVVSGNFRVKEPRDEQQAIVLLGRLGERTAIPHLERRAFGRLLMSFDPFRFSALSALAKMRHERALTKLRATLHARAFVDRTMAVQALGQAGDVDSLPLLRQLVGKPDRVEQESLGEVLKALEPASSALE